MKRFILVMLLAGVSVPIANAADETVLTEQQQKQAGGVVLASAALKSQPQSKIQTEDYVLDLETADVAIKIVSWKHTDNSNRVVAAVPFSVRTDSENSKVWYQLTATEPIDINRELATKIYQDFGNDIYWSTYLSGLETGDQKKFDREKFTLTTVSKLKGTGVEDARDVDFGQIVDVGLNEKTGDILYCVVKSNKDGSLRAIPLGAFVGLDLTTGWKINLTSEAIAKFPSFNMANPPQFVDRGWEEYIAVRYGRRGLQEESKGN